MEIAGGQSIIELKHLLDKQIHWLPLGLVFVAGWGSLPYPAAAAEEVSADSGPKQFQEEIRPLLNTYCLKCHGPERPKGGVNLARFQDLPAIFREPKLWETVAAQLRDRNMPPEGKPQPGSEDRDRLISWVEGTLANLDERHIPKDPGRVVIHRLNRTEYNNTIRDLFGVDTKPADKFPVDGGGGGGFDNNADTLFVPPILMEKYLEAAIEVLETAKPDRLLVSRPGFLSSSRGAARKIIAHFGFRAFRRPVSKEEIEPCLRLYDEARERGDSFEAAVKFALRGLLVSPRFLFRIEQEQPSAEPYLISEYELASRLSYFLWSSMPDEELFRLAAKKRLRAPGVLDAQVRRMIADPRAKTFADNFAGQWLHVRDLKTTAQPDRRRYPTFTPDLRDAMHDEVIAFFHALLRDDRSLLEILDADYTFANEALAKHYGIEGVTGEALQRVSLRDTNRGGVLAMGAVLTLTSYPLRTSPVLRGKWILEEILGTPPPPPPPLIKSLPPDDRPREGLSFRQRLEKHREDPNCAACHKRMDPLGFGLENFDAIGRWRTEVSGQAVDSNGELSTGETFQGPAGLKRILLAKKDLFLKNLTEKMLAYALGRGLEYYDTPTVRRIAKRVAEDNYHSHTLITEVVKSYPFQYRRNGPVEQAKK
jgi:mono/diheme cytochrome c family protein